MENKISHEVSHDVMTKPEVMLLMEVNEKDHDKMQLELQNVTAKVQEVQDSVNSLRDDTKELLEVFRALQGLFKVISWIGKIAKPLVVVATMVTAITLYFQGVKFPVLK